MTEPVPIEDVVIRDDPDEGAYLLEVGGERAGKAEYRVIDGRHVFTHTEVDSEYSGRGLATRLVTFALDDMRDRGKGVVPLCPLFGAFIKRHPEYEDLVDHEMTMQFKRS